MSLLLCFDVFALLELSKSVLFMLVHNSWLGNSSIFLRDLMRYEAEFCFRLLRLLYSTQVGLSFVWWPSCSLCAREKHSGFQRSRTVIMVLQRVL